MELLGCQIRFCEDLEGVAALLPRGEVSDALLKFGEARQPREEAGCAEMRGAPVSCDRGIPAIHAPMIADGRAYVDVPSG